MPLCRRWSIRAVPLAEGLAEHDDAEGAADNDAAHERGPGGRPADGVLEQEGHATAEAKQEHESGEGGEVAAEGAGHPLTPQPQADDDDADQTADNVAPDKAPEAKQHEANKRAGDGRDERSKPDQTLARELSTATPAGQVQEIANMTASVAAIARIAVIAMTQKLMPREAG